MVRSKLVPSINYIELKSLDPSDTKEHNYKAPLYEASVLGINTIISIGNIKNTYISQNIVYYPIYLIKNDKVISQIGVYEMFQEDIPSLLDDGGDINLEKAPSPLLYSFVKKSLIQQAVYIVENPDADVEKKDSLKKSTKGKKLSIKSLQSLGSQLDKVAVPEFDKGQKDEDERDEALQAAIRASLEPVRLSDVPLKRKNIPVQNLEQSVAENKAYRTAKDEPWVQSYYHNSNFKVVRNQGGGDCLFMSICQAFCKEFTDSIKNKIAQFDCLRDAMSYYFDIKNTFPRNAFDQLQNQFVFKGYKIITWNFNRSSYEENDKMIRIPVYAKNYCVSGDRVAIAKCYTVGNDKDTYIVFHDLPDNTKVVPRVYELVKKYKNVVVIAHDQSIISSATLNGVDKFKEVNRFDLVKSGYCNLSELTPVKLPSTKKGSTSSYTANYFYKVESCYFRCSSVFAKEINDSSITKLYFPVSNGKPVNNYLHFHQEKNKLNSYFFSEVGKLFNVSIYAVSNNVAATVKFKNRADFVDIIKYIQDKWNACSDEVKSLILEYISCKTDDAYNIMTFTVMVADISTCQKYDYKLNFCSELLKKANKLKEIES